MNTLPEVLATVTRENADRTAVVDGDVSVTYAQLERRIASLAEEMARAGVRKGDRVALMLPNSLDFVTSYFAIITLGALVVPLNDHYQQNELLYFLDECGVSLLITSHDHEALCRQVLATYNASCELVLIEDQKPAEGVTFADVMATVDPDAPVMFQFSSGSTGTPKRIARTHRNLTFELNSFIKTLGITSDDRFLGAAPFSHVNGLMRSMMACMRGGAALYPVPKFERRAVASLVEQHRLTVFIAVPFMFGMLGKARFNQPPDFSSLRLCVSASAPMPVKANEEFKAQFGLYVRQLYGSTETGTISVNLSPDVAGSLESIGTPIRGVEVEAFREDGSVADEGELAEFAVKSPAMISGYDKLPEVNKEAFRDGWFFTGDLGRKEADGLLYLVGRKKFFINKGGYKIDPREIELVIEEHANVEEVAVVGVPTSFGDEKVKAVIVPSGECTEEAIFEHCRGRIADFKIPTVIEFRDALPKSPTGKIRRKMLL